MSKETTFVSVDRARVKQNHDDGEQLPVIRVHHGTTVSLTSEVEILGPSRVTTRADRPAGVPAVFLETSADVRFEAEIDPGATPSTLPSPPTALAPPPRPKPVLSQIFRTDLLEKGIAAVAAALAREPARADLLRRLGDLQRQAGNHAAALASYRQLLALLPGDTMTSRLVALLSQEALPPATLPEPFLLVEEFLPPEQLSLVLAVTAARRDEFDQTPVHGRSGNVYDRTVRWCTHTWSVAEIAGWFEPLVLARGVPALTQFGLAAQPLEIRDSRLTRYGHDGFFGPHVDRGPGVETRVMGFVYYFYFPPKRFQNGGLAIYDRDLRHGGPALSATTVLPQQNQLLLLPSDCWHEVLPVDCPGDAWEAGRFTFGGWICRRS
jgi:hypothetical protein